MEQQKKIIRSSLRRANSIVHTLKNLYDKTADADFKEFQIMGYDNVRVGEVSDLKRLMYLKKMQLARNGTIDTALRQQLAQQKQKQRLIADDAKIKPVGRLKVMDGDVLRAELQLGYEQQYHTFKVSYSSREGIPKWKSLEMEEFAHFISHIHPNESDNLRLEHTYLYDTMDDIQGTVDPKQLQRTYNQCVFEAFHKNKYFDNSILKPDENLLENPELYLGKQFRLPLQGKHATIATLTEANGYYLSFQSFLRTTPKPETHYFTIGEFKRLFLDSQIELIALLKFDLRLGVKAGILQIGRNVGEPPHLTLEWDSYDSIIKTSELTMKAKYYLCKEVIMNKNFVIEKDAISLESQGKRAFLKKHYKTGKWHFAETRKSSDELHFRPMTPEVTKYIRQKYSESKNFGNAEKYLPERNSGKNKLQMSQNGQ